MVVCLSNKIPIMYNAASLNINPSLLLRFNVNVAEITSRSYDLLLSSVRACVRTLSETLTPPCCIPLLQRAHALKSEPENVFDILEERRRGSDIGYALRTFSAQPYRGATPLSVSALNRMVQESPYLRYVISEVRLSLRSSTDFTK